MTVVITLGEPGGAVVPGNSVDFISLGPLFHRGYPSVHEGPMVLLYFHRTRALVTGQEERRVFPAFLCLPSPRGPLSDSTSSARPINILNFGRCETYSRNSWPRPSAWPRTKNAICGSVASSGKKGGGLTATGLGGRIRKPRVDVPAIGPGTRGSEFKPSASF